MKRISNDTDHYCHIIKILDIFFFRKLSFFYLSLWPSTNKNISLSIFESKTLFSAQNEASIWVKYESQIGRFQSVNRWWVKCDSNYLNWNASNKWEMQQKYSHRYTIHPIMNACNDLSLSFLLSLLRFFSYRLKLRMGFHNTIICRWFETRNFRIFHSITLDCRMPCAVLRWRHRQQQQ